jgi:hypothetical protein
VLDGDYFRRPPCVRDDDWLRLYHKLAPAGQSRARCQQLAVGYKKVIKTEKVIADGVNRSRYFFAIWGVPGRCLADVVSVPSRNVEIRQSTIKYRFMSVLGCEGEQRTPMWGKPAQEQKNEKN